MSKQNNKKGKNKKYNKDIMEELHFYEEEIKNDRQYYSNIGYLSEKERIIFENKFSKPRNKSQEYYYNILNKKNKKIIVSTGPAGTGKTLFAVESAIKQFLLGKGFSVNVHTHFEEYDGKNQRVLSSKFYKSLAYVNDAVNKNEEYDMYKLAKLREIEEMPKEIKGQLS